MPARRLTAITSSLALVAALLVALPTSAQAASLDAPTPGASTELSGDVHLSWGAVSGASRYRIEIRTGSDPSSPLVVGATTFARSYTPTATLRTAEPRTLYWSVAGQETASDSTRGSFSDPQPINLDALSTPTLQSPADGTQVNYPTPVTFTWSPVRGAVSYTLEYSSDSLFLSGVTTSVTTTGTSATPTNPLARSSGGSQITWYWRVRANFAGASGAVSGPFQASTRTFTLNWGASVSRPTLLTPEHWEEGDAAISDPFFSWEPVAGAKEYQVAIGQFTTNGLVTTPITGSPFTTSATFFAPPRALTNRNYFWQVTAVDASGNLGVASEVREFNRLWGMQAEPTLPGGITEAAPVTTVGTNNPLSPTEMEFSDFELTWEPLPRATYYEVEVYPITQNEAPVLTCRTAGTSATIVAYDGTASGSPSAVTTRGQCLWTPTVARRIQPNALYRWRVRGVDLDATNNTSFTGSHTNPVVSQWSDPQTAAYPGRERYVYVTEDTDRVYNIQVDGASWNDATHLGQIQLESSPLLSWTPVKGVTVVDGEPEEYDAVGYEVRFALDAGFTTGVSRVITPVAKLRTIGVFANNSTGLPYYWDVRPLADTNWSSAVNYMDDATVPLSWQKSTAPTAIDAATAVAYEDGATVLHWTPQFSSSATAGGSRGYHVQVFNSSGSLLAQGATEYPYWVLRNPSNDRPLTDGSYKVYVAPLDADGKAGTYAPALDVTVARPTPQNITASARSAGAVLRWDAVNAATAYQVQWWNTGTPGTVTTSAWLGQTAYSVDNLPAGQYQFRVKTRGAWNDESSWSSPAGFTISSPTVPLTTNDKAVLSSAHRVLQWNSVPGASRYLVTTASTRAGAEASTGVETLATSYAVPTDVTFGTPMYWRVTAVAERAGSLVRLGTSSIHEVYFRTPPKAPKAPSLAVSGKDLSVSWPALSMAEAGTDGALQYIVRYRAADLVPAADWTTLAPTTGAATSKLVTGLVRGTSYEFQVSAASGEGPGPWSPSRKGAAAALPGAPTNVQASGTLGGLSLKWRAPSGAATGGTPLTGYTLKYRKSGTSAWTQRSLALVTSIDLAGLSAGSQYEIELSARNAVGTGPAATVSGQALALPSVPRSVAVKAGDAKLAVTWKAPANNGGNPITGYVVEYRAYAKGWGSWSSRNTSASTTKLDITGLTNGSKYQVRVSARTKVGDGPTSTLIQRTPASKPGAPKSVKVKAQKGKSTVTWKAAPANGSKITGYIVQYSTNGKKWKQAKAVKASVRKLTTKVGKKGKKVYFRVIAKNKIGKGTPSAVITITKK